MCTSCAQMRSSTMRLTRPCTAPRRKSSSSSRGYVPTPPRRVTQLKRRIASSRRTTCGTRSERRTKPLCMACPSVRRQPIPAPSVHSCTSGTWWMRLRRQLRRGRRVRPSRLRRRRAGAPGMQRRPRRPSLTTRRSRVSSRRCLATTRSSTFTWGGFSRPGHGEATARALRQARPSHAPSGVGPAHQRRPMTTRRSVNCQIAPSYASVSRRCAEGGAPALRRMRFCCVSSRTSSAEK